jgi:two-component system response regulator NreC
MNTADPPKIRVLLADDHAVLRAGLRALLQAQPDMEVVGEANDGNEAIRMAEALAPHVVLMDIEMRGAHGLQATGTIRSKDRHVRVLILSAHDDQGYLRQALRAGASGYLLKESAVTDLLTAIRTVHR